MKKSMIYSRKVMTNYNIDTLKRYNVSVDDIAEIAYKQQSKYLSEISYDDCLESVYKILSLRDVFHILQLGAEIDRLAESGLLREPIGSIVKGDLGVFGVDEIFGLYIAGLYGAIGETNFGEIDVRKPAIIKVLDEKGKQGDCCATFIDDIVGAIAAAASTRVAQICTEKEARQGFSNDDFVTIFDLEEDL